MTKATAEELPRTLAHDASPEGSSRPRAMLAGRSTSAITRLATNLAVRTSSPSASSGSRSGPLRQAAEDGGSTHSLPVTRTAAYRSSRSTDESATGRAVRKTSSLIRPSGGQTNERLEPSLQFEPDMTVRS